SVSEASRSFASARIFRHRSVQAIRTSPCRSISSRRRVRAFRWDTHARPRLIPAKLVSSNPSKGVDDLAHLRDRNGRIPTNMVGYKLFVIAHGARSIDD